MGKAAGKKKIVTGRPVRAYMSKAELAELKCVCVYCSEGVVFWVVFCVCVGVY
jgi:hypothetical protein